jgi:hypothetical protein
MLDDDDDDDDGVIFLYYSGGQVSNLSLTPAVLRNAFFAVVSAWQENNLNETTRLPTKSFPIH